MSEAPDEPREKFAPSVKLKADGALATPRYERMALMMAEGIPHTEAWKAVGGTNSESGSRKYGQKIFRNNVFIKRVEDLKTEKEELEADPIWGEAKWMANQLWRHAMATGDPKGLSQAADLRYKIAEKQSSYAPAPERPAGQAAAAGEESTPKASVGAPSAKSTQTMRDPAAIKEAMMRIGRQDEDVEETEDEAEDA